MLSQAKLHGSPTSSAEWSFALATGCACNVCYAALPMIACSCNEIGELHAEGHIICFQSVGILSKAKSIVLFPCVAGSYQLDHLQGRCAHSWRQKRTPSKGGCRWAAHIVLVFKQQS